MPTSESLPTDHERIVGERIVARLATLDDLDVLATMVAAPSVRAWWGERMDEQWRERLEGRHDDDTYRYVVEVDGEPVGFVQWYEEADPEYRHAGIDLFIADEHQERGLGTEVVRTVARWLVEVRGHHRLVIDPSAENHRAIRCYERVGFRPIGRARQRERSPEGTWRDSLLMDLLADELT